MNIFLASRDNICLFLGTSIIASRHTMLIQFCFSVDAMSLHCININTKLYQHCVHAGLLY